MKRIRHALLLIALLATHGVSAGEPIQPSVYWRADFGDSSVTSFSYGMAIRQAPAESREATLPALATLDFNQQGSAATLAGLPLWRHRYQLNQDEEASPPQADSGWFPSTSTLLIAGGVVIAIAALSGGSHGDEGTNVPQNSPCALENPLGGCTMQCPDGTVGSCIGVISNVLLESSSLIETRHPR